MIPLSNSIKLFQMNSKSSAVYIKRNSDQNTNILWVTLQNLDSSFIFHSFSVTIKLSNIRDCFFLAAHMDCFVLNRPPLVDQKC